MSITSVVVDDATLALLPEANMSDAYRVVVEASIDAVTAANRIFGRVPWWIARLIALRNRLVRPLGLITDLDETALRTRRMGFLPVISETPERVVLGLDDKHLDFRVAVDVLLLANTQRRITTTTLVRTHSLFGRTYLAVVLPFHRVIVPAMLAQAAQA